MAEPDHPTFGGHFDRLCAPRLGRAVSPMSSTQETCGPGHAHFGREVDRPFEPVSAFASFESAAVGPPASVQDHRVPWQRTGGIGQ